MFGLVAFPETSSWKEGMSDASTFQHVVQVCLGVFMKWCRGWPTPATERSMVTCAPTVQLAAAIVVPICAVAIAGALLWLAVCRRSQHRSIFLGSVKPPGVSPATTLLITDIYNSTVLWEALPSDVMDSALRLHHGVLRGLAAKV
jgi:hypothetical protein